MLALSPITQKRPVFQFSTKVTWETPFSVATVNSFGVHLKSSLVSGLLLVCNKPLQWLVEVADQAIYHAHTFGKQTS